MSYLSIKQRFKAFLKGFKKCDLEKVIDFLKYVIHDYSEKPAKFMDYMMSDNEEENNASNDHEKRKIKKICIISSNRDAYKSIRRALKRISEKELAARNNRQEAARHLGSKSTTDQSILKSVNLGDKSSIRPVPYRPAKLSVNVLNSNGMRHSRKVEAMTVDKENDHQAAMDVSVKEEPVVTVPQDESGVKQPEQASAKSPVTLSPQRRRLLVDPCAEYDKCRICEIKPSSGKHYGVYVCNSCNKFFQRSLSSKLPFQHNKDCVDSGKEDTINCRKCRYDKCIRLGMKIDSDEVDEFCYVCKGKATGIHYGVPSCFQCAKFYMKMKANKKSEPVCKRENNCPLDKSIRRMCAKCRYERYKKISNYLLSNTSSTALTPPHNTDDKDNNDDYNSKKINE